MLHVALAIAFALVLAVPGGLYGGWAGALFFGAAAGAVGYVVVGRRISRRIEREMAPLSRHIDAGRIDRAIAELERVRRLSRWQLGLARAIDGQIGVLIYAHKGDFARARPYLERAPRKMWHAQAMLGATLFRNRRPDEGRRVFERALKRNRKVGLLYAAYAWCEQALGAPARALPILNRGAERVPQDERLRRNLLAVQNRKKLKMRGYGAEWWALRLEAPPRAAAQPPPGARPRR